MWACDAVMPPVQPEPQEDSDPLRARRAERLGLIPDIGSVVLVEVFSRVQHGVEGGGRVTRQEQQRLRLLLQACRVETLDPRAWRLKSCAAWPG